MLKKSEYVRQLTEQEDYTKALRIAKGFRLGISSDDLNAMKRGYECIVNPDFYRQLGYDPKAETARGIKVLKRLYGRRENTKYEVDVSGFVTVFHSITVTVEAINREEAEEKARQQFYAGIDGECENTVILRAEEVTQDDGVCSESDV